MWLNQMLKDRQEILVLGELTLFLAAWGLGIAAAVDNYHARTNGNAANNVAANNSFSVRPAFPATGTPKEFKLFE